MDTSITQATPVEYEFEIHATADDLAPQAKQALQAQRSQMDIKGFRKGKVPLPMVKKMYGTALAQDVGTAFIQEAFEEALDERDDLEPVGPPEVTTFEYTSLDDDLHAVVRFNVRPEVELDDVSDEHIPRLVHEVSDEELDEQIDAFRKDHGDLMPLEEGGADETDFVNIDMQRIDPSTDTPIIGEKEEDLTFFLDDERLRDELREALLDKKTDDTFRVRVPPDAPPNAGAEASAEEHFYDVTVNEVKRLDLPELDDDLVQDVTDGEIESVDALRSEMRDHMQQQWDQQSEEMLRSEMVERMLDRHPLPVPPAVTERFLDSFVQQVEQENDGDLPDDFDEAAFRERNRTDAHRQAHWMFIRDALVEDADLEVDDDDLEVFFADQEQQTGMPASQLSQMYRQMPDVMDRIEQQILSDKVYDELMDRFDVEDMDRETFEAFMEEKHDHDHDHDHEHGHDHDH